MADIPAVPPAALTPLPPGNAPQLSNVPVQQAPPTVTAPAQLAGTVVSSNSQTQQLNIQTAQGQIIIQSSLALPPNTPVTIELSAGNGQMRATITVSQQGIAQTQAQTLENALQTPVVQATISTPPPLQEGSTVTALQLPAQPPTQPPATPSITPPAAQPILPLQMNQIVAAIQTEKETGLEDAQLPLPPEQLQELSRTPDIQDFLKRLPPQLLRNIADYFAGVKGNSSEESPASLRQMISAYAPQKPAGDKTAAPAAPESGIPEHLGNELMQVMRAPLQARATPSLPAPSASKPASFSPLTSPLDALIASSEQTSRETSGFTAILRQLLPQGAHEATPAPQNMFQLRIIKVLPPDTPPAQVKSVMAKLPAGAQASEVETETTGGQPILKTPEAHYVVTTPANVPTGSKVIFEATPMSPEDIVQQGITGSGLPATQDSSSPPQNSTWPALQEALKALPPASAAAQVIRNTLPSPTPQLAPTALFFLAAMRSGSISNWLGANTLQALQQTAKKGLVDALSDDFDKLSAQTKDTLPGNWRAISIPLRYDEQISQMQFYVRHQNDQEQGEKSQSSGKPATRFILNLSLSRMGAMQLDGFIQKKSFDVILRTEDKLPFDMRQELMKRFAQGLDQVQMQGGISFQTRQQGWMVPEAGKTAAEV